MNATTPTGAAIKTLKLKPATREALKAYGTILGSDKTAPALPIDFYDGAAITRRGVDFKTEAGTDLVVVELKRRPFQVRWMERHFKHTQGFVSLGAKPFVCVLAPPTVGDMPDLDQAEAFLFDGTEGFVMHIGTWHEFPFAVVDDTNVLVILRKEATDGLVKDNVVQNEALGPDLDKKDIMARKNVLMQVAF